MIHIASLATIKAFSRRNSKRTMSKYQLLQREKIFNSKKSSTPSLKRARMTLILCFTIMRGAGFLILHLPDQSMEVVYATSSSSIDILTFQIWWNRKSLQLPQLIHLRIAKANSLLILLAKSRLMIFSSTSINQRSKENKSRSSLD